MDSKTIDAQSNDEEETSFMPWINVGTLADSCTHVSLLSVKQKVTSLLDLMVHGLDDDDDDVDDDDDDDDDDDEDEDDDDGDVLLGLVEYRRVGGYS